MLIKSYSQMISVRPEEQQHRHRTEVLLVVSRVVIHSTGALVVASNDDGVQSCARNDLVLDL